MPISDGQTVTLAALAARTTGANGTAQVVGAFRRAVLLLNTTVADTDAGDTLDVYVDVLAPDGATWLNAVHFTQVIGTDAASKEFAVLDSDNPGAVVVAVTSDAAAGAVRPSLFGTQMRARWAITDAGADDASFTFGVYALLS